MDVNERNARDKVLLDQITQGGRQCERAIAMLFREYRTSLLIFLQRNGVQPDIAEDVLQEVFVRVVRSSGTFRGESAVSSWLFRIARNLAIDAFRSSQKEILMDDAEWQSFADATPCIDAGVHKLAMEECVGNGFNAFSIKHPERSEALRRVAIDGWSIREVAVFLDRTETATREYLSQTRKRLRQYLLPCRELLTEID